MIRYSLNLSKSPANLHVPRRQPRHPLEDDGAEGPGVGEERGPLAADHHLRRLARVQEVALGQSVADEEVLEVPHPEVGDLVVKRKNEWQCSRLCFIVKDFGVRKP